MKSSTKSSSEPFTRQRAVDTAASSWTKCISSQADILRTVIQLQRSKSLPIDVVCHHKRRNKPHSCGRSILQNLGKHVDRWRTFRYQPDAEQLAATALSQIFYSPLCFSSLESLEYECVERNRSEILWLLEASPALTHFALTTDPCYTASDEELEEPLEVIVLKNLVQLDIRVLEILKTWEDNRLGDHSTPVPDLLTTLSPHLEELLISSDSIDEDHGPTAATVPGQMGTRSTLSKLKCLQIRNLRLDPVLLGHVIQARHTLSQKPDACAILQRVELDYAVQPAKDHYAATLKSVLAACGSDILTRCQLVFDPRLFLPGLSRPQSS
ncbi:hypothetical protein BDV98DRAFT_653731 [Pterulicium gracile]|uniref:Uncharacterized protein n=1 Tax=Pterulicium gracile TaxID=1884261 RepID=A0A5C3QSW5_9AGAR|nr:hypothetical protein BDV98DRAFT_653731 [Pterula gracilis]